MGGYGLKQDVLVGLFLDLLFARNHGFGFGI